MAASWPTRSRSCRASTRSWARSTGECHDTASSRTTTARSRGDIVAQYPQSRSAIMPLAYLAQDQDGWLPPEAIPEIAELVGVSEAEVQGTVSFYTMFKRRPCGKLVVSVCTNVTCLVVGGPEILEHLEHKYARRPRRDRRGSRVPRRVRQRTVDAGQLRVPRTADARDGRSHRRRTTKRAAFRARTISGTPV